MKGLFLEAAAADTPAHREAVWLTLRSPRVSHFPYSIDARKQTHKVPWPLGDSLACRDRWPLEAASIMALANGWSAGSGAFRRESCLRLAVAGSCVDARCKRAVLYSPDQGVQIRLHMTDVHMSWQHLPGWFDSTHAEERRASS